MRARIEIHQSLIATDIQGISVASVGQSDGLQWTAKIFEKIRQDVISYI